MDGMKIILLLIIANLSVSQSVSHGSEDAEGKKMASNATTRHPVPDGARGTHEFQAPIQRVARPGEFPWVVLLCLANGLTLPGALVTRRWVVAATELAYLVNHRVFFETADTPMYFGYALAGFTTSSFLEEEGEDNFLCPRPKMEPSTTTSTTTTTTTRKPPSSAQRTAPRTEPKPRGGIDSEPLLQCRYIAELLSQNDQFEPARLLVLMRVDPPFVINKYLKAMQMVVNRRLPTLHREQCTSVWFEPEKQSLALRKNDSSTCPADGSESQCRRQVPTPPAGERAAAGETPAGEAPAGKTPAGETPAGETPAETTVPPPPPPPSRLATRWVLYARPVGLWHAEFCERRTLKNALACEDSLTQEKRLFADSQGRSDAKCTPRARRAAVAECQSGLAAFRLNIESLDDILFTSGDPEEDECTPQSNMARRLWVWAGASADWVYMTVNNCTEMAELQVIYTPRNKRSPFPSRGSPRNTVPAWALLTILAVLLG